MAFATLRRRWYQLPYLLHGLTGRWGTTPKCPACGSNRSRTVGRKLFHEMRDCQECSLLHRYPLELAETMRGFYQSSYLEPGLTTELPDTATLAQLKSSGFRDSPKDFSWHIALMQALGIKAGDRVLDFGASWGYTTWQMRRAGFAAEGFEISEPRAEAARRLLDVPVSSQWRSLSGPFRAIFSSHVIEHVPDPKAAILEHLALLESGGLWIAFTPNGSAARRARDRRWQDSWGQVHPVLLTEEFVRGIAGDHPLLLTSKESPELFRNWNQQQSQLHPCDGDGLVIVIAKR